ncbi:hypothetical protein QLX08_002817 [Tetragonisca angustula]|uniref:Retrotransposon gag domain-containing protein n=1 Tax=Tetragonisca angustula TaxID=166442 RepID=A0AAW1AC92_9HYME
MSNSSSDHIEEDDVNGHWLENENITVQANRTFIDQYMQTEDPFIGQEMPVEDASFTEQNMNDKKTQNEKEMQELKLRELNLLQRKKALWKNEVLLTKRKIMFDRKREELEAYERSQFVRISPRVTLDMIAELLDYFKGNSEDLLCWSEQLLALKLIYKLSDDEAKILMGMRMQGKARKWLLWNPEIIQMNTVNMLQQLKNMFYHKSGKNVVRKHFKERVWERNESFDDYFYDKIILAKRIPINDERELVDNIIDGIQDEVLKNLAKMHCFETTEALILAFEQLSLSFYGKSQRYQSENTEFENNQQTSKNGHRKNKKKRTDLSKKEN